MVRKKMGKVSLLLNFLISHASKQESMEKFDRNGGSSSGELLRSKLFCGLMRTKGSENVEMRPI
ncbi:hypothetical protein HID58_068609 [Brassica napus]|uniref:Uncharacterized protein n=1 Tax=Brassica napus TaxID=3708 RepID=A0ABQ7ZMG5_BRANA|nr:hypothetical protein HID58_068609 [Brassica napus]